MRQKNTENWTAEDWRGASVALADRKALPVEAERALRRATHSLKRLERWMQSAQNGHWEVIDHDKEQSQDWLERAISFCERIFIEKVKPEKIDRVYHQRRALNLLANALEELAMLRLFFEECVRYDQSGDNLVYTDAKNYLLIKKHRPDIEAMLLLAVQMQSIVAKFIGAQAIVLDAEDKESS